jgi:DinB superfamily
MPAKLHGPGVSDHLKERVRALRPDSERRWGRMSVDQMLWHVNEFLRFGLGELQFAPIPGLPRPAGWLKPVVRWIVLYLPWPHGAKTYSEAIAGTSHDFAAEQRRCLELIDRTTARDIDGVWPLNPMLGRMTGAHWSRIQAKHLDHHLRQFGV